MEAEVIHSATDKARRNPAWEQLSDSDRAAVISAVNRLMVALNSDDHEVIRQHMDALNEATHSLAELMMNTAVSSALKGTKV